MITLGTGVGGGIIIDGMIYSGSNYAGAEVGHTVIQHNGRLCTCGRKGCWEAYSSATGLINMTREACSIQQAPNYLLYQSIGGGISRQGDYLLEPVKKIIEHDRYTKHNNRQTQACIAELGNDAGIFGAAFLGK